MQSKFLKKYKLFEEHIYSMYSIHSLTMPGQPDDIVCFLPFLNSFIFFFSSVHNYAGSHK